MTLNVPVPAKKLDPFQQGDEVAELIERYIVAAEKQIRGVHAGALRLDAVTEAVQASVVLPKLYPKVTARHMVQVVYHHIARNLPAHLRHSNTEPPAPERR